MTTESHSRRGKRRNDDYSDEEYRRRDSRKRRKEHSKYDNDNDDGDREERRIRKRDRKKESKSKDRDNERRSRRDHYYDDSESEGERRSSSKYRHRDRRRRDKSSQHKRTKKSRSDEDSEGSYSSDYDKKRSSKRKKKSSSKSRKHDKRDKKRKPKPDKSKLISMGEPLGRDPETTIDKEKDYFSYHNEFWIYLFREEGIFFNDLDTDQARSAFGRFAKEYNAGRLEEPYYTRSFPNEVIEESKTTKHSWGFKTTTAERKGLGDLQKGIRRQTEYNEKKTGQATQNHDVRNLEKNLESNQVSCAPVESLKRNRFPTAQERTENRRDNKKWKDRVKLTHEELTGGSKDHRERQLEKKREQSAKIHGAHRDKEAASVELSDAALYGGNDSLEATRARLMHNKKKRSTHQSNRIQVLQAKEEERKNNMLKMLGLENLQGKKKLEIAPRK